MALAAVFLFAGHANAISPPNPVDACNNSDVVGRSCAYSTSGVTVEGTCQINSDGVLVCVPN
ncbi:hypothetical protein EV421DRAFT_1901452 [Armillaria borealis]|uniref:Hydrophobin n=1 Tax=Armillaria borealis TaxID=47425 RepID=A0AA39JT49_9AGAR|nr:hypothetical protein EV421DRAFT_1901452 [Armillaria borealis]